MALTQGSFPSAGDASFIAPEHLTGDERSEDQERGEKVVHCCCDLTASTWQPVPPYQSYVYSLGVTLFSAMEYSLMDGQV